MKRELRKSFLHIRNCLESKRRAEASGAISLRIESSPYDRIASFSSMRNEIDLSALNQSLARAKRLLLPRMEGSQIAFYQVDDLSQLQKTGTELFEPNPTFCPRATLTERDLLLVPALSFDRENYRLGYGKGHYDRLLAMQPELQSVGIGFIEQMHPQLLPRDPWDRPVKNVWLF